MNSSVNFRTLLLVLGDLILFYISLFLALSVRYQEIIGRDIWIEHQMPFLYVHILWLFIFYVAGAYDIKTFISYKKIFEQILKALPVAGISAIVIFYLIPSNLVTPKTNLLIDILFLAILLVLWRRLFWSINKKASKIKIAFLDSSQEVKDFFEHLVKNPQFGYAPINILEKTFDNFVSFAKKHNIQLVVVHRNTLRNKEISKQLYKILPLGISIISFENFYEMTIEKVPVSIINEEWFLENLKEINKKFFEIFKRIFDIVGAVLLGIPTLIILPFVALMIKTESRGSIFYKQKRIGKNEKIFEIVKFRSMVKGAEKNGAVWAKEQDSRITKVGKILRKTSIDELPQLWNVLKGEMSFVGPRPERPEFVETLEKEIPHYAMRHLIKPGLSGWAQIKYPYGASVRDAREKLQFDLYYLKNRSVVLDLAISAKTLFALIARKVH